MKVWLTIAILGAIAALVYVGVRVEALHRDLRPLLRSRLVSALS